MRFPGKSDDEFLRHPCAPHKTDTRTPSVLLMPAAMTAMCGAAARSEKTILRQMFIRLGYDIEFEVPAPVAIVSMLSVHPSRALDLRAPDEIGIEPTVEVTSYLDGFGNRCSRFVAPPGTLRLRSATLIEDPGTPDPVVPNAREHPVGELPNEALIYLLNSRYCEVDRLSNVATELFGAAAPGWGRVQAICNWVNTKVTFGYQHARPTRTALDVFTEFSSGYRSHGCIPRCYDTTGAASFPRCYERWFSEYAFAIDDSVSVVFVLCHALAAVMGERGSFE